MLLGPHTCGSYPFYLVPLTPARSGDGTRAPRLPYTDGLLSPPQRRRQLAPHSVCQIGGPRLRTCLLSWQTPLRTDLLAPTSSLKTRDAHFCALSPSVASLWAPCLSVGRVRAAQAFISSATSNPLTIQRGLAWSHGIGGHRLLFPTRSPASTLTFPDVSLSPFWKGSRDYVLAISNRCRWQCRCLACAGPLRCIRKSACRLKGSVSVRCSWGLLGASSLTYCGSLNFVLVDRD